MMRHWAHAACLLESRKSVLDLPKVVALLEAAAPAKPRQLQLVLLKGLRERPWAESRSGHPKQLVVILAVKAARAAPP